MTNFDSAFEQVKKLVEDFQSNESKYLSSDYQEAEVRRDFIDKFLFALGWDIYHDEQKNPYEQEVKVEKGVYVGKQQKRADYAFYLTPNFRDVKFYIEAKKPSRNLSNADDYFQSIRYGWNAGTQITFLTDFQEFHILDCRIKPNISSILNYKIKKYHYLDFLNEEKFSEIYWLISREAVVNNSLEKFAESLPKPKGKAILKGTHRGIYQSIDEAFLEELDEIRDTLAKAFKKANAHLESEPLTEMTQRLIDRLVFIRFLEDKQIEPDHYVSEFANSKSAWKDFRVASRKLDAKYNGVVFKKYTIDGDNFIEPDNETFSSICEELAHVNSPYNFDIIPIHILGSIYERFLGKVVVATDKRVRIEEKPEVRKAGGVYYTPQYIVNYIVDNTVGKLIDGKTPKEISKMRFAVISCGSGSFLITVFDRLLEYNRKWYQDNPEQAKKDGCYFLDGKWVLSLKQKQKILTNNVYGVDLDHQAVEVTQLSLYLKLLEDETTATTQDTWVMFKEQLLPNLKNNIVCGNSLIGTDIREGNLFNHDEEIKLKPMNFEDAFPEVMRPSTSSGGGFDAIVGNPPYLKLTRNILDETQFDYYNKKYTTLSGGSSKNLFQLFIEKAINLNPKYFSYIAPEALLTTASNIIARKLMLSKMRLKKIVLFDEFVFKDAVIGSTIFVLDNSKDQKETEILKIFTHSNDLYVKSVDLTGTDTWDVSSTVEYNVLLKRICEKAILLKDISSMSKGMVVQDRKDHLRNQQQKNDLPFLLGGSIHRYYSKYQHYTNYNELSIIGGTRNFNKQTITPRLLIRRTGDTLCVTFSGTKELIESTLYILTSELVNLKYLLALLNSKLMTFYLREKLITNAQGYPQILMWQLEQLPIIEIDKENESVTHIHDKLIQLANQMLESKKQLANAKTESEKEYLEKKCSTIDKQIDKLVYELYDLTEEEIKIVEGNG